MIVIIIGIMYIVFFLSIRTLAPIAKAKNIFDNAIKIEYVSKTPEFKKVAEKAGCSIGYGKQYSYHEHYKYNNVVSGYKVRFKAYLKNGTTTFVDCDEGDRIYKMFNSKVVE